MKNLLIYINPSHSFGEEHELLAKIQIENLLDLGWKPEDIVLVTNFPYEYMGIKSKVVGDEYFYELLPNSTKFPAVAKMFENGLIEDALYWMHDFDNFQLEPIDENHIIQEMGGGDLGLCDYGRRTKFNGGSAFFTNKAGDIFKRIVEIMNEYKTEEERATMILINNNKNWANRSSVTAENYCEPAGIADSELFRNRIRKMNVTYNIWAGNIQGCYKLAFKPLKSIHFNPFPEKVTKNSPCKNKLDYFMHGENILRLKLMNDRLKKIFNKHGLYGNHPIDDLNALEIKRYRRVWKPFLEKYGIKSICEVGVFASQNFHRFLKVNPEILVGVDAWIRDGNPAHNDSSFTQEQLDAQCEYFKSFMLQYPNIRLYRQYSDEAAKNFPDEYFDLIYIDADHSYEGVKKDLEAWWPKVKKGRFFTGDDYSIQHAPVPGVEFEVIRAVDEFAKNNNLTVHKLTENGWCIIK